MSAPSTQKTVGNEAQQTIFSFYWREILAHPWLFTWLILGTLVMQAADLISPLYMKQFFNTLVLNHESVTVVHGLIITLAMIALLAVIDWLSTRVQIFSLQYLEARAMSRIYANTFDYLIAHSYQFFTSQFTGTLTRRVSKFATAFETLLDSIMLQFAPTAIFVTGAVIILFIRNHTLGALLGVWAVLFVAFQVWVAKLRHPYRVASSKEDSRMTGALSDAISNQNTISLFSGNLFEHTRFVDAVSKWRVATLRSWNADEYIWAALGMLIVIINIAMLYGAIIYWQRGLLTIGDFVLIQAYLLTTFQQLIGINRNLRRLRSSTIPTK
jgi:ATP-binding cassette subfamily B protein